jgi:hypothetical protein
MVSAEIIVLRKMPSDSQSHMAPEEVEMYSAGRASEGEAARWDEHLLVCGECRQAVLDQDYRAAMRSAARELRRPAEGRAPREWRWTPAWVSAAALLAAAAIVTAVLLPRWSRTEAPVAISLTTVRGPSMEARAPAGRPLRLSPDLTGLPARETYRMEVVDAMGRPVWTGDVTRGAPNASLPGLAAGVYFARLRSPEGALLREYGLEIGAGRGGQEQRQ